MKDMLLVKTQKLCKPAIVTFSLLYILIFIAIALIRMNYPFELNWMEGGLLDVVNRILDGKQLYTPWNM
jgi:hypothetical protein